MKETSSKTILKNYNSTEFLTLLGLDPFTFTLKELRFQPGLENEIFVVLEAERSVKDI